MGRVIRSCFQSVLKLVNSVIGLAGTGMILYSLWMLRIWFRQMGGFDSSPPWFIYTFLGLGIFFCFVTCSGHVAAETINSHCLSCYMMIVFLLVILEAAITADVFFNTHWEEDFPMDTTGKFNEFKNFVRSNADMSKWIAISVVSAQAFSVVLAMILRALGPDSDCYYDSDDDSISARLPLLRNQSQTNSYSNSVENPNLKNDSWNIRIHDKASN